MNTLSKVNEANSPSKYRLKPTLINTLAVIAVYIFILIGSEKLSGVKYTDFGNNASTMFRGVLIPLTIASAVLTIFSFWSGWYKDIWRDRFKIKGYWWLNLFLIFMIFIIGVNLLVGNIANLDPVFVLTAATATALVGYSEETIFRGFLVNGARNAGFDERGVLITTMILFGLFHSVNIILGQDVSSTLFQMLQTGFVGGIFFIIYKKSGLLIMPIIIHALWDFSLFTGYNNSASVVGIFLLPIMYAVLIFTLIPLKKCRLQTPNKEL